MKIKNTHTDHTLIINEIERSIKIYNWDFILSLLPAGSFLVGGYIRDIILGRISLKVDVDIVVPLNAIDIGKKVAEQSEGKFIILDKERQVVRVILSHISIDIANQISSTIEGDLQSRDFSINSIAFSFDEKSLIDPLNGIKDIKVALLKTYSEKNLLDDPLRILRCFRFVSELNFNIDTNLITFISKHKGKLRKIANERINYEIQRIVRGEHAYQSTLLIKKFNLFGLETLDADSFSIDLRKIDFKVLNQSEKEQFLPLFFLSQIFDQETLKTFKFSKNQIVKTNLLRKWHIFLLAHDISQLNELERFQMHKDLEDIVPSFIFYLPKKLRSEWINRWRDKDDKLFHPVSFMNGDEIKKHLKINDGPLLGKLLNYLSMELAYDRLNNFDEAIYKAKQWIEQNAPKCD